MNCIKCGKAITVKEIKYRQKVMEETRFLVKSPVTLERVNKHPFGRMCGDCCMNISDVELEGCISL